MPLKINFQNGGVTTSVNLLFSQKQQAYSQTNKIHNSRMLASKQYSEQVENHPSKRNNEPSAR